jgi:hypothetical protein
MPITDSRLKVGMLTLDGIEFASQATNVTLTPDTAEDGDALEVLSGETITPDESTSWVMAITAVQDFDDPDGFINFALGNAGELVPYSWTPNDTATGVTYTGSVRVRPVPIGGDVASRNTTAASWPIDGAPTPAYPA